MVVEGVLIGGVGAAQSVGLGLRACGVVRYELQLSDIGQSVRVGVEVT